MKQVVNADFRSWSNRLANVVMERVLPHRVAIRLMGRVMRGMYARL